MPNRFFGSDYEEGILSFFRKKYRDKAIDVVVVVGSAALDFISRRRGELWPNVPVVFAAIDEATIAKVTLPPNVTGVTMQLTLQDMVRTANNRRAGSQTNCDRWRSSGASNLLSPFPG